MMNDDTLTPRQVIDFVAPLLRTTPEAVCSASRQRPTSTARHLCAYIMRKHIPEITYREIADNLGGRDCATVLNSVRRVRGFLDTDCAQTTRIVRYVEQNLVRSSIAVDPNQMTFAWMLTSCPQP